MKKISQEDALILGTVQVLKINGFVAWRQPNTGKFRHTKCVSLIFNMLKNGLNFSTLRSDIMKCINQSFDAEICALKGVPDVLGHCSKTGKAVYCEIKTTNDKLSIDQKAFRDKALKNNALWFEVRDIQLFEGELRKNIGIRYANGL